MSDRAEVRYHQSGDDHVRAAMEMFDRTEVTEQLRKQRWTAWWWALFGVASAAGLGLLIVEVIGFWNSDWREPEARAAGVGVGAIVGLWMYVPSLWRSSRRTELIRQYADHVRSGMTPVHDTPLTLELTPNGLRAETVRTSALWRWPAVREFVEFDWADQLVLYDNFQIVIPHTAFDDDEARLAFLNLARRYGRDAGGDRARVVDYLEVHDAACPACRYALRANPTSVCPECGAELTLEELTRMHARITGWDLPAIDA